MENTITPLRRPACVFDIDGTLARAVNRQWWEYDQCIHDELCIPAYSLARGIAAYGSHHIILVTGRPEQYRGQTEAWLDKFDVRYARLIMRPDGDYTANAAHKVRVFQEQLQPHYDVHFFVDDNARTVQALRDIGQFVFDVGIGNWDEMPYPSVDPLLTAIRDSQS